MTSIDTGPQLSKIYATSIQRYFIENTCRSFEKSFSLFFLEFSFVSTIVYLREFEKDIRFVLFRELWRVDLWQKFQVLLETSFRCTNNFLEVVEKI